MYKYKYIYLESTGISSPGGSGGNLKEVEQNLNKFTPVISPLNLSDDEELNSIESHLQAMQMKFSQVKNISWKFPNARFMKRRRESGLMRKDVSRL